MCEAPMKLADLSIDRPVSTLMLMVAMRQCAPTVVGWNRMGFALMVNLAGFGS